MFTCVTASRNPRLSEVKGDPRLTMGPDAPHVEFLPAGKIVKDCIDRLEKFYPELFKIHKLMIMPDHYHLLLEVLVRLPFEVTHYMGRAHSGCTSACRKTGLIAEEQCLQAVARGAVLISPFISPHERAIMSAALEAGGSIVKVEYEGFAERANPTGRWHDLCAAGRALFIAEAGSEASRQPIRRNNCVRLNSLAERLTNAHESTLRLKK